jgi:hypothetical protein
MSQIAGEAVAVDDFAVPRWRFLLRRERVIDDASVQSVNTLLEINTRPMTASLSCFLSKQIPK